MIIYVQLRPAPCYLLKYMAGYLYFSTLNTYTRYAAAELTIATYVPGWIRGAPTIISDTCKRYPHKSDICFPEQELWRGFVNNFELYGSQTIFPCIWSVAASEKPKVCGVFLRRGED